MLDWLQSLSPEALYVVLFLALFLEGTGLPGVIVEPFFFATGILVGEGRMPFIAAWLVASAGNVAGNLAGYAIGRRWLDPLLRRFGPRIGMTPERVAESRAWFQRYGAWTVLVGRWFGPIRTPAILFAGAARVPLLRFAVASAVAALSWTAAYQLGFTLLGRTAVRLLERRAGWLAAAVVAAVAVGWLAWHRWSQRRSRRRARDGQVARADTGGGAHADAAGPASGPGEWGPARQRDGSAGWAARALVVALVALAALAVPASYALYQYRVNASAPVPRASLPAPNSAWRLLVVAPHPDDEALGAGGIIQKTLAAGGQVKVVVLTAGDGFGRAAMAMSGHLRPGRADYVALGRERLAESREAMASLGLPRDAVVELGFPDKGLEPIWAAYWDPRHPYRSARTGADAVPYPLPDQGTPYDASDLASRLVSIIQDFRPTVVVAPYPLDAHPDHRAGYDFTLFSLAAAGCEDTPIFTYVVHHGEWPAALGADPEDPLAPPRDLLDRGPWLRLSLDDEEAAEKLDAIQLYRSQMRVMGSWLEAFARADEVYSAAPRGEMKLIAAGGGDSAGRDVGPGSRDAATIPVLPPSLKARLEWSASLVSAGADEVGHTWQVTIRTRAMPDPAREYRVRWWMFRGNRASGYVATVWARHVTVVPVSPDSPPWPSKRPVRAHASNDGLVVSIPAPTDPPAQAVLLEVETGLTGTVEDRSAWVMLTVPQEGR